MIDVVLLAHGSPDPRAQDAARVLATAVEERLDGGRVHCAFLQHGRSLTDVCIELAGVGVQRVVVVPAFLTPAFHVREDVPVAADVARQVSLVDLVVTEPIGTDPLLVQSLDRELPPGPVVLAIAGTSDTSAQERLARISAEWSLRRGELVVVAHASQGSPTVAEALEEHHDAAVAALVLFPGLLPDRIARAAAPRPVTAPLYSSPATVEVVIARIREAA
jgi:sirohydrochlorin ferrochelatase